MSNAAGGPVSELTVLQAVRLKGRVSAHDLAATLAEDVTNPVERLVESGLLIEGTTLRISQSGRVRLDELLTEERAGVDAAALAAACDDFHSVNTDFKMLVTDWQLNRDAAALARMDGVHERVLPIIAAAAAQLPRLDAYRAKLHAALEKNSSRRYRLADQAARRLLPHRLVRTARGADPCQWADPRASRQIR